MTLPTIELVVWKGGGGGQAEATETDFGHHLARTDPFERADSPPSDGVRSKK